MEKRTTLTFLPLSLHASTAPAATGDLRLLSDGKGRVLSKEERAKESGYIQSPKPEPLFPTAPLSQEHEPLEVQHLKLCQLCSATSEYNTATSQTM
jgi:hypothetical protein